jgi:hypothetical protein
MANGQTQSLLLEGNKWEILQHLEWMNGGLSFITRQIYQNDKFNLEVDYQFRDNLAAVIGAIRLVDEGNNTRMVFVPKPSPVKDNPKRFLEFFQRIKDYFEGSILMENNNCDFESHPPEIGISLRKFREDHLGNHKTAFIMMQFGKTKAHQNIVDSIKGIFDQHGIVALRADDKEYHNNLLSNVLTYIYGCDIGVAVFERIEADEFNPNVSFEVGYMRALNKPICLLKDKTMNTLHTDLLGELYKSFDPQDPNNSIPGELEKWLKDKDIIN